MSERDILIDVSRLVWRLWRRGLPTGIDRVCLAYLDHFRSRSRAVVQRRGHYFVMRDRESDRLFDLFFRSTSSFRSAFMQLAPAAFSRARQAPDRKGLRYLNVGHTGLDEPSLRRWIVENQLQSIFFVHDLIPLLYPEFCRAGEQDKHRKRIDNVLRSAKGLVSNSRSTLTDLASYAASRDLPIPPSIAAPIAGPAIPDQINGKDFDRPHFVIVGTIEARKNHSLILHIWKRLVIKYGAGAPILVVIGQRGWEATHAIAMLDRAVDLKGHVLEFGRCTDDELASLIASARALLMPSFAEGFGLPVAEALQLGTPVIASDLPVFREFAAEIPTYLDCLDGPAWEAAILAFLKDAPERERQLRAMKSYRAPDWPTHFKVVDTWMKTLT